MQSTINNDDWKNYKSIMVKFGRLENELIKSETRPEDVKKVIMDNRKKERVAKMFLLELEEFEDTHGFCPLTGEKCI